ncbi:MAG: zinc-ribbon domain-containing protein [Ruminococcus sp.]|nr:zinc-ribbon domain-containing protein [Ruminococcus sp.]
MFCPKCGSVLEEGARLCPICATTINPNMIETATTNLLSIEDYLAISKEYQSEKEAIRKKYRNMIIIGSIIIIFGIIILPLILVPLTIGYNSPLNTISAFLICMVVLISGVIVAATSDSAMKKKTKELGVKYYQEYVQNHNSDTYK